MTSKTKSVIQKQKENSTVSNWYCIVKATGLMKFTNNLLFSLVGTGSETKADCTGYV